MNITIKDNLLILSISQETDSDTIMQELQISRKKRYLLYQQGMIVKNEQTIKHCASLQNGDILVIKADQEHESIPAYDHPIKVLYEDALFLIIDKETKMLVHSDGINTDHTICNCVQHYFDKTKQNCPVRSLHRLDMETSGILLFCKFPLLQPLLDHMMETKQIHRHYLAIITGSFPEKKQIYTDPISRDRHDAHRYITHPKGKAACTKVSLVQYSKRKNRSLVRCTLESGRTHQIRVHLSAHGHPLVNDPLYGNIQKRKGRLALHSADVSFFHPLQQRMFTLHCPLPQDLKTLL